MNLKIASILLLIFCFSYTKAVEASNSDTIRFVGGYNPPFEYINEKGEPEGFHIDLIKSLCQSLDINYTISLMEWHKALESIVNEESDVLMGINYSKERAESFDFGLTHNLVYLGIITRTDKCFKDYEELSNLKIIITKSGFSENILKEKRKEEKVKNVTIYEFSKVEEGLKLFDRGVGDVMLCNNIIARYLIKKNNFKLKINEVAEYPIGKYSIAVKKGNKELIFKLNNGIAKLKYTGELEDIYNKWFSDIVFNNRIPKWIYSLIFLVIIVLIITIIFIFLLNKQVRAKTKQIKKQSNYIKDMNVRLTNLNHELNVILKNSDTGYIYLTSDLEIKWENLSKNKIFRNRMFCITQNQKCYKNILTIKSCRECALMKSFKSKKIEISQKAELDGSYTKITVIPILKNEIIDSFIMKVDDVTTSQLILNDLTNAKNKAIESDKLKSSFLANMSHEIRTPLNAIVGFSELIGELNDEEERKQYLNLIKINNELLLNLINDILDLSKIESGMINLNYEVFDISELFNQEFIKFNNINKNDEIKIISENRLHNFYVKLDKNRFIQVCTNFISNSLKHTKVGEIVIGMDYQNKGIKISVKDTGMGIDKEYHHLVFNRFEKMGSFVQGTGLGLSICKAIVEAMGGKIGFTSEKKKGSEFWAWFPCKKVRRREETDSDLKYLDPKS